MNEKIGNEEAIMTWQPEPCYMVEPDHFLDGVITSNLIDCHQIKFYCSSQHLENYLQLYSEDNGEILSSHQIISLGQLLYHGKKNVDYEIPTPNVLRNKIDTIVLTSPFWA